jgi:hypothetical protein
MKPRILLASLIVVVSSHASAAPGSVAPGSPYAGQQSREIKSLSADEVGAYLSGKGMGFAKAAELNGYPGPAHVLELASELGLSAEQRSRTEALFAQMEARAISVGRTLVNEERELDRLFASKSATSDSLAAAVDRIAALQGRLRVAHLDAHLAQVQILSPAQVARYVDLRGYGSAPHSPPQGSHRH